MRAEPTCPRCGGAVTPPGLWSSAWQCPTHGEVLPMQPVHRPSPEGVSAVVAEARVPSWLPWPLPHGWVVTGVAACGDDRTGAHAVAVASGGPNPVGGMGELVVVAEEPGVGLGARYAGLAGPDPGADWTASAPQAKVHAAGHPTPLWYLAGSSDRAVYVGESLGCWLWVVLWPASAGVLLAEELELVDLREVTPEIALMPFGALCPRLTA